ncbi:MAG: hypothetical protein JJE48_09285, partial [Actinobacteria bacterium]|nr:hypothetical protein [Actinomycetota bacterium]
MKPEQNTPAPVAVISATQGGVQLRMATTDGWLVASAGAAIYEGDSIQTEAQGKLSLALTDGAKIQV